MPYIKLTAPIKKMLQLIFDIKSFQYYATLFIQIKSEAE